MPRHFVQVRVLPRDPVLRAHVRIWHRKQWMLSGVHGRIRRADHGELLHEARVRLASWSRSYLPDRDLTALVDTSGAYLPGHGTPTVIVFGRNRKPSGETVRAALWACAASHRRLPIQLSGLVWSAIESTDSMRSGSTSAYIHSRSNGRGTRLHQHPVIFGGGADLWFRVDAQAQRRLGESPQHVAEGSIGGEDEAFASAQTTSYQRHQRADRVTHGRNLSSSDIRCATWGLSIRELALFPYSFSVWSLVSAIRRRCRTTAAASADRHLVRSLAHRRYVWTKQTYLGQMADARDWGWHRGIS